MANPTSDSQLAERFRNESEAIRRPVVGAARNGSKFMRWEYQVVSADTVEDFVSLLNKLGGESWEATSAAYAAGESKKVSLGQGMAPSMKVGAATWVALMKRPIPD